MSKIRLEKEIRTIAQIIGDHLDVTVKEMQSKTNEPDIVFARHVAIFYCNKELFPASSLRNTSLFFGLEASGGLYATRRIARLLAAQEKTAILRGIGLVCMPDLPKVIGEMRIRKVDGRKERKNRRTLRHKDHKRYMEINFGK